MNLNIRKITIEDWPTLVDWWRDWEMGYTPEKDFLPENGTGGIIVETEDKTPICSVFLYNTNSKLFSLNWPLSNKNFRDKKVKNKAFDLLLLGANNLCKESGGKYIIFYGENISTKKFQERLMNVGWVTTGFNRYSELIKVI
jgi:hypothetical protein